MDYWLQRSTALSVRLLGLKYDQEETTKKL